MKNLKENGINYLLCLFELVVGVLLLINPVMFTTGIIMATGVLLIVKALTYITRYFRTDPTEAINGQLLTKALIALAIGFFCIFKTDWFLSTFPVLTMLFGVIILFTGFSKIQLAVDMLRLKRGKWHWAAINAGVSILCAAAVILNPFSSTSVLWIFTGCSLILEAVIDVVTWIVGIEHESKAEVDLENTPEAESADAADSTSPESAQSAPNAEPELQTL